MFLVCSSRSRAKANKENNKEALVKFHYKGMGVVRDMLVQRGPRLFHQAMGSNPKWAQGLMWRCVRLASPAIINEKKKKEKINEAE